MNDKTRGALTDAHAGCERGFSILSEAWYAASPREGDTVDEVLVGMYSPGGGTSGEFGIRWIRLGGTPSPRLEVFNDAWGALQQFPDLLEWMASVDGQRVSPQQFAEALRGMGVKDVTARTRGVE